MAVRMTKQRRAVIDALKGRHEAVTAQDLHQELRRRKGAPGLATVYRTLASLAEAGEVDTFTRDGEQAYKICRSGDHHHHLVCETCGGVEEVEADELESWIVAVARKRGFRVTGHLADVYGECRRCAS